MITSHNIAQNEIAKHRLAHGISVRTQIYQSLASLLDDMSPLTLNAVNKALAPYGAGITERDKNMYDDNSLRAEIARTMKELEKDGIV